MDCQQGLTDISHAHCLNDPHHDNGINGACDSYCTETKRDRYVIIMMYNFNIRQ